MLTFTDLGLSEGQCAVSLKTKLDVEKLVVRYLPCMRYSSKRALIFALRCGNVYSDHQSTIPTMTTQAMRARAAKRIAVLSGYPRVNPISICPKGSNEITNDSNQRIQSATDGSRDTTTVLTQCQTKISMQRTSYTEGGRS
jgi:hypothetical protein